MTIHQQHYEGKPKKKKRHKWDDHRIWRGHCIYCGMERTRYGINPEYKDRSGNISDSAGECIPSPP